MRTSISKNNILKSSILFFTISAFVLSALLFTSCSDAESIEITDDSNLIEKIVTASKVTVDASTLPSLATSVLDGELADTYVEKVQLAQDLGFKVTVVSDDETFEDADSDVFFTKEGRELKDTRPKRSRARKRCFEFVYPIVLIMPDDSSITLESKEDWSLKKAWYEANPDATERPELVFPVDVTLEDGTVQTLIDKEELKTVKDSCKKGKDKRKCFKLVLPVSFTMADDSVIEVTERKDFKLLRKWKKENPDATEKPAINFPVDIEFRDGTTETIADQEAYQLAKEGCEN